MRGGGRGGLILLAVAALGTFTLQAYAFSAESQLPPPSYEEAVNSPDWVPVPAGMYVYRDCIHEVPDGAFVDIPNNAVWLNGVLIERFKPCPYSGGVSAPYPIRNLKKLPTQNAEVKTSIPGRPKVGDSITAKAIGFPAGANFAYRWLRNGNPIDGATAKTYRVQTVDVGKQLTIEIYGNKSGYAGKSVSRTKNVQTIGETRAQALEN